MGGGWNGAKTRVTGTSSRIDGGRATFVLWQEKKKRKRAAEMFEKAKNSSSPAAGCFLV
jgi:hypothetical protein